MEGSSAAPLWNKCVSAVRPNTIDNKKDIGHCERFFAFRKISAVNVVVQYDKRYAFIFRQLP